MIAERTSTNARVAGKRASKKDQILALYVSGITGIEDLALMTDSRPGYVAAVLQGEGLLSGYHDLYTSSQHPQNVYSKFFANRLGFKDLETSEHSVAWIDRLYQQFARSRDRAGQHHAMLMALTMYNRARFTGKQTEADPYRRWLEVRLEAAAQPDENEA